MKFSKDSIIREVLENNPNAEAILSELGLHCLYCPCATSETLEQAAKAHNIDLEKMLAEINK